MQPDQLVPASFTKYPPKARQMAVDSLPLLQQLPLAFTPFLLKEIVGSDRQVPGRTARTGRPACLPESHAARATGGSQ